MRTKGSRVAGRILVARETCSRPSHRWTATGEVPDARRTGERRTVRRDGGLGWMVSVERRWARKRKEEMGCCQDFSSFPKKNREGEREKRKRIREPKISCQIFLIAPVASLPQCDKVVYQNKS